MKWPLHKQPVPRSEMPLHNLYYLHAIRGAPTDPTIVWGTDVDMEGLGDYLRERNRDAKVVITTSHVLLQAAAQALVRHPEFNRRVVGRRVFAYREINLRFAFHDRRCGDVGILLLPRANELRLAGIAHRVWASVLERLQGKSAIDRDQRRLRRLPAFLFDRLLRVYYWLDRQLPLPTFGRLDSLRSGAVFVNDLSFHGAAPIRFYKSSTFPDESSAVSVTLGPTEQKAVVRDGAVVAGKVATLFVRADHRIVDAYQVGRFAATLRQFLQQPAVMESGLPNPSNVSASESDGGPIDPNQARARSAA